MTACQPGDAVAGFPTSAKTPTTTASSSTTLRTCAATALRATARQAAHRPQGTGTGAAIIRFTNTTTKPCIVRGHPEVAGAANGSPELNVPLKVTPKGPATPVRLSPGTHAWLKLIFVQVQGEGDGYCKSGSAPVIYPTMVIALPGSGSHQVALPDGQFAECDGMVTATAVSAVKPS
ncbi:DUF4232 domain-containing protein [Streptomyces sp. NPDC058420]|uniref:DUF4232 domain-containing protein n=1 Tax=Streptomyces sp. NPDC058420 TaxID=3346489 RepID=UPI003649BDE0